MWKSTNPYVFRVEKINKTAPRVNMLAIKRHASLDTILTSKLKNEKRQKDRKQKLFPFFFFTTRQQHYFNQSVFLIQRLNLCRDPPHFSRFDTAVEKLN